MLNVSDITVFTNLQYVIVYDISYEGNIAFSYCNCIVLHLIKFIVHDKSINGLFVTLRVLQIIVI